MQLVLIKLPLLRLLLKSLILLLFFYGQIANANQDEHIITSNGIFTAEYSVIEPNIAQKSDWHETVIPHSWRKDDTLTKEHTEVWYRFRFDLEEKLFPNPSVYMPRLLMNGEWWINDRYLGNGGKLTAPLSRNWNRPQLYILPESSLKAKDNIIIVRVLGYPKNGVISPMSIAPYEKNYDYYQSAWFYQVTLGKIGFYICLLIALLCFFMWLQLKQSMYLYFMLTVLCWASVPLYLFSLDVPLPHFFYWKTTHFLIDCYFVTMTLFCHRLNNKVHLKFERALLVYISAILVMYIFYPVTESDFVRFAYLCHLVSLSLLIYLFFYLILAWKKTKHTASLISALGIVLLFIVGIRDMSLSMSNDTSAWLNTQHLSPSILPIIFLVLAWYMGRQMLKNLSQSQQLSHDLSEHVLTASTRLEHTHKEELALKKKQSIIRERNIIYRDLHDDLGAKLLSLIYTSDNEKNADIARTALQDLRDVVSRTQQEHIQLSDTLADIHSEHSQRCQHFGISFIWNNELLEAEGLLSLNSDQALSLHRLMRELIGFFIRTDNVDTLFFTTTISAKKLCLELKDESNIVSLDNIQASNAIERHLEKLTAKITWTNHSEDSKQKLTACRITIDL